MSNTSIQEPSALGLSSGSGQTLPSRPLQPISDASASKRVCFYKSGDYKFTGHRMVINARTFKTFDALLDALSKKVPLPFGVRTITTPRGTNLVKSLDDLQDGGSYVCSDQRRVKPLNLDEVNRRQVPWNTTRPLSAGRRKRRGLGSGQFSRRNEVAGRPAKVTERAAVRTPKKLVVIKNRDPTVKRTIVLQRRTAPTFDALLDYLSHILQFPVLKLYSTDGRRVDGLGTLILCSGVVVAAGNEPFRLGNYGFHRSSQMSQATYMETVEPSMLQPRYQNNKSFSSGRGSRNFSLSSERYIVNQINSSRNGSINSHRHRHNESYEAEHHTSMETRGTRRVDNEDHTCILPQDDDIEKSFRVNQDGSMTVEMKVRLTIKEEEMLHWTTTLSRSSLSKTTVCASISESGNSSPDSNNAVTRRSSNLSGDETKEENHPTGIGKGVGFNDEQVYEGYTSTPLGKAKTSLKRTPTPGPRQVKKASVESVKTVTESGVQESTLGHYSYMERTADGETTEGYCVVRHSSSSNRPVPKPRKTASEGASNKGSHSSVRSSGVAEVLQIQNNGMEVTETVMHIYESEGCYDNYFANEEYSADGVPLHGSTPAPESKPSTESGHRSSSNDCDIDFSCQPLTADSLQRQKEEMLSLSSEPISPTHEATNNLSSVTGNDAHTATNYPTVETVKKGKSERNKKTIKPDSNHKGSVSTSNSDKKLKESVMSRSSINKHSSAEKLSSNTSMGKKPSLSSSESAKSAQKSKGAEKKAEGPQSKKSNKDVKTPREDSALLLSTENVKRTPPKRQTMKHELTAKDVGYKVSTSPGRPQMKKDMSDILQPKKSLLPGKKTMRKPKSMIDNKTSSSKKSLELSESVSMPSLNPTPSEIHQYVESWLEKVSQDQVPYTEDDQDESEPPSKVVFRIGCESESDEKSECQTTLVENLLGSGDAMKKSASCLSVPHYPERPVTSSLCNEPKTKGLCVSMPSVRVDPVQGENKLRTHKSVEVIGPTVDEATSSTSNILSPQAKIKPVLRQLCSSIQCIRRATDTNNTSNLEKSNSLPDFSTQVASVFGSSCKAFLSFLSVMTLRESLTGSAPVDMNQPRSDSEAMLMMESLQKISVIEDEEEQWASLTDLQSRASSQFRERWKDFQILRERLESEPLSPRVSETEFALDVISEGGDVFEDQHLGIDELMEELNMPKDLRAEIASTIQQARSFYPVDESTIVETDRNQSESEEDVENFIEECNDEIEQSTDPDTTCIVEAITEKKRDNYDGDIGDLNKRQPMYSEQAKMMMRWSEKEPDGVQETVLDVKDSDVSQTERVETPEGKENETEEKEGGDQVDELEEDREDERDDDGSDLENIEEKEREEETDEWAAKEDDEQDEWEAEEGSGKESIEKVEEEMTVDEEEEGEKLKDGQKEFDEGAEEGEKEEEAQEASEEDSGKDTDEREGVEETEEEEKGTDEAEEDVDEEEKGEEGGDEEEQVEETKEEADMSVETDENIEEQEEEEKEEEADEAISENIVEEEVEEVIEETEGEEELENIFDEVEEEEEEFTLVTDQDVEEGAEGDIEGTEEEEEAENMNEEGDEVEEEEKVDLVIEEKDEEEDKTEVISEENDEDEEEDGEAEVKNKEERLARVISDEEEEEEEERDAVIEERDEVEDKTEVISEENDDEEEETGDAEVKNTDERLARGISEEEEEEEEERDAVIEERDEDEDKMEPISEENDDEEEEDGDAEVKNTDERLAKVITDEEGEEERDAVIEEKDEEEDKTEVISEENEDEEEEDGDGDAEVKNTGEKLAIEFTDEEEEEEKETERDTEEEEKCDRESGKELEKIEHSLEEESVEAEEVEELEDEENMKAGQTSAEEEREDDEEDELNRELDRVEKQESRDEVEEGNVTEDAESSADDKGLEILEEEASYSQQHCGGREEANSEHTGRSPTKYSSEGQCEYDKGDETDTANEPDADEGGGRPEDRRISLPHPVEISQELLDFVNSALQSSSLIFTYDARGNIRLEPDSARVLQAKRAVNPKSGKDSSYGLKCLPSPSTSDLSDYRPETSESGGYKTQESLDIVTESGEEASERPFPVYRHTTDIPKSKLSPLSNAEVLQRLKSAESFSSCNSITKASREDLSYFSAASSLKAYAEGAPEATRSIAFTSEKDITDGVLIDQGRWLLKENHLIRKSPPISLGMYGNVDSTSVDTGQEKDSEDSPPPYRTQHNPLAALSSSELEEMARPQTPKCIYYNMPHGSDSDPFLDDSSVHSGKKDTGSVKGRGFRVSPTVDTHKTWPKKNGSLSSFASVEFKMPDRKVHPEGQSAAVTQTRRTSSGGGSAVQSEDSLDTLHVRCGQYCPIL